MDLGEGGQWFWDLAETTNGEIAHWVNPGDGFDLGAYEVSVNGVFLRIAEGAIRHVLDVSESVREAARQHLLDTWQTQRAEHAEANDPYLDTLLRVRDAGFLDEYTVHYFGRSDWQVPAEVRLDEFRRWQRDNIPRHRPQMRIIGSWNYRPL